MKKVLLLILVLMIAATAFSQKRRRNRYVVGDLRVHTLESEVFGNKRKIRVLVPEGYRGGKLAYPVLYLNDGQNLFDPKTAQVTQVEWGVDETVFSLVRERKMRKVIVVGVDNAGRAERANEYLPWDDEFLTPRIENPKGEDYPRFLVEEVIPFVERKYRVQRGKRNRALGGSSYGALISLYTVLKKPELFGGVILESPSFYVDDSKILDMSATANTWPEKVYMGVGTNEEERSECIAEDESHEAVVDVRRLEKIIGKQTSTKVLIDPCAVHSEIAWGSRLSTALEYLFPYVRITKPKKPIKRKPRKP